MSQESHGDRMEPEPISNAVQLFALVGEKRAQVHRSQRELKMAKTAYAGILSTMIGEKINLRGRPTSHVYAMKDEKGKTCYTSVACYSLLDQEETPRDYEGATIVDVHCPDTDSDNKYAVLVNFPGWGENYDVVPFDRILNIGLQEEPVEQP
jgi:hypothetical protein